MSLVKILIIQLVMVLTLTLNGQTIPLKSDVIETMKSVNDYWISTHADPGNRSWDRAVYFTGNQGFYKTYSDQDYLNYGLGWAEKHNWNIDAGINSTNADQQCAGQVYLDLFELDEVADSSKIEDIKGSIDNMILDNNTTAWWWIDALYMAMPSFVRLGVMMNDDSYFSQMHALYTNTKTERGLFNSEIGLWYRDESFKPPYKTQNDQDSYWARGNGWVFGAHVKVLQQLPESHPDRAEYIETFQAMAAALKDRQRSDGFWNVSLNDPDEYGGPETSGTSFFTYGIAWGINNGLLSRDSYLPVVELAWEGLTSIAVQENGFLSFVQGVGVGPASSQPVTSSSTTDFGVGAFLLAGTEVVKIASGEMPEPPKFWVSNVSVINETNLLVNFNKEVSNSSAVNISNYSISNKITVKIASIAEDAKSINLEISPLTQGKYDIIFSNITSTDGDHLESGESKSFLYNSVVIADYSSYEPGSTNIPDNTLDLDLNTRWSAFGEGEFIKYDLGKVKLIESVAFSFYNGDRRSSIFKISLSENDVDFVDVFDGQSSGTTLELDTIDIVDTRARYIVYTGYGNTSSEWNSVTEFGVISSDVVLENDASLSSLEVEGISLVDFESTILNYDLSLPNGTTVVPLVSAITNDVHATVKIINASQLPGSTLVLVTAEDGTTTQTYKINFTVAKSIDASLSELIIDGIPLTSFSSSVFSYEIELEHGAVSVPLVAATARDGNATIDIQNASSLPGSTIVLVTAQDESTKLSYEINFSVRVLATNVFHNKLILYPNPASNVLNIECDQLDQINIFNMGGKLLKHLSSEGLDHVTINIEDLPRGLHFLEIIQNDGRVSHNKIVLY